MDLIDQISLSEHLLTIYLQQAANYVAESVQSATATASKETNKEVAKDSNAPASTRLSAGTDAVKDKINESGHSTKADVHKGTFSNWYFYDEQS